MNNKSHLLIKRSFIYENNRKINKIKSSKYSYYFGYWLSKDQEILIKSKSEKLKIRTKKDDIETGEDQKGE